MPANEDNSLTQEMGGRGVGCEGGGMGWKEASLARGNVPGTHGVLGTVCCWKRTLFHTYSITLSKSHQPSKFCASLMTQLILKALQEKI